MKKGRNPNALSRGQRILLLILTFCAVYPFVMIVIVSFKSRADYLNSPIGLPQQWILKNYETVFQTADIFRAFRNSLVLTVCSVAAQLLSGSLAAYALARMKFKGKRGTYIAFLLPLFMPVQAVVIPLYVIYKNAGLLNSLTGLIIIYTASGLPLVILTLSSFIGTIPVQISEAAFMEGLSHFQVYRRIILPLLKPAVATVIIISGLGVWNDFYLPLLMLTDVKLATLPLKTYLFVGQYRVEWTKISVCIVYLVIPVLIVYFFLQKQIIEGVAAGSVKG